MAPLLIAATALAAVLATDLIDFDAYHLRYTILDASSASSWSHRADAAALAVGAAICLLGAWRLARRRWTWVTALALLAFFFVDEVSGLHAQVDQMSYGKALYAPILLLLVLCVWRVTKGRAHVVTLGVGLVLLLASYLIHIFGLHILHALGWSTDGWAYQVKVGLKEGAELAGLLLALMALLGSASAAPGPVRP